MLYTPEHERLTKGVNTMHDPDEAMGVAITSLIRQRDIQVNAGQSARTSQLHHLDKAAQFGLTAENHEQQVREYNQALFKLRGW